AAIDVSGIDAMPPAGRRVRVAGVWDRVHILLSGRSHRGEPGVVEVTPLRLPGGGAVLVELGWLPASDAFTAHAEQLPPEPTDITGIVDSLHHSAHPLRCAALASDTPAVALWS